MPCNYVAFFFKTRSRARGLFDGDMILPRLLLLVINFDILSAKENVALVWIFTVSTSGKRNGAALMPRHFIIK
jgi:hypothetical protein